MSEPYLPPLMPRPSPAPFGLDAPFWEAAANEKLVIQRCRDCRTWRWGPEWICPSCRSFDYSYEEVAPEGRIFSWERVWHGAHPLFIDAVPYLIVLVELPQAGNVRLIGNLLGDPGIDPKIGSPVVGCFESYRDEAGKSYTLLQWRNSEY